MRREEDGIEEAGQGHPVGLGQHWRQWNRSAQR